MGWLRIFATTLLLLTGFCAQAHEKVPLIAAASDLQFALKEIAQVFELQSGLTVKIVYGSSGNLAAQIRQGAPFRMLLAADEKYVETLERADLTRDSGKPYALGRLALFASRNSTMTLDENLNGLRTALRQGEVGRIAMANPEHAPYGRAAREVLQQAKLWGAVEKHLVIGENVAQAAQFALMPGTSCGLIAYSFALSPQMRQAGQFVLLPDSHYQPLRQRMVLMKNAGETAVAFYDFIQQPQARQILQRHGFGLP